MPKHTKTKPYTLDLSWRDHDDAEARLRAALVAARDDDRTLVVTDRPADLRLTVGGDHAVLERTAPGLAQGVIGTARGTLVRTALVAHDVHVDTTDDAAAYLWRVRHNAEFAAAARALAELLG